MYLIHLEREARRDARQARIEERRRTQPAVGVRPPSCRPSSRSGSSCCSARCRGRTRGAAGPSPSDRLVHREVELVEPSAEQRVRRDQVHRRAAASRAVSVDAARPFTNVTFAAVATNVAFSVAPGVLRKMKLALNPPLIGTLPLKRKSRLFIHDVTTRHAPAPCEFEAVPARGEPSDPVTSIGWFGTSTVKQWSSTFRPTSMPPPMWMLCGRRPSVPNAEAVPVALRQPACCRTCRRTPWRWSRAACTARTAPA